MSVYKDGVIIVLPEGVKSVAKYNTHKSYLQQHPVRQKRYYPRILQNSTFSLELIIFRKQGLKNTSEATRTKERFIADQNELVTLSSFHKNQTMQQGKKLKGHLEGQW